MKHQLLPLKYIDYKLLALKFTIARNLSNIDIHMEIRWHTKPIVQLLPFLYDCKVLKPNSFWVFRCLFSYPVCCLMIKCFQPWSCLLHSCFSLFLFTGCSAVLNIEIPWLFHDFSLSNVNFPVTYLHEQFTPMHENLYKKMTYSYV